MKFWLGKPTALPVAKKRNTHRKLSRLPKKIFEIPSRIFKQVPTGSSCPCFFLNKEMQFWQSRPGALPAAPGRDTQTPLFLVSGKPRGDTLSSCSLSLSPFLFPTLAPSDRQMMLWWRETPAPQRQRLPRFPKRSPSRARTLRHGLLTAAFRLGSAERHSGHSAPDRRGSGTCRDGTDTGGEDAPTAQAEAGGTLTCSDTLKQDYANLEPPGESTLMQIVSIA